jgi:DNA invertase Pin-like site-specific DNA recombinase
LLCLRTEQPARKHRLHIATTIGNQVDDGLIAGNPVDPRTITAPWKRKADKVLELAAQKLTRQEIAEQTGIGVASVYRVLSAAKAAI